MGLNSNGGAPAGGPADIGGLVVELPHVGGVAIPRGAIGPAPLRIVLPKFVRKLGSVAPRRGPVVEAEGVETLTARRLELRIGEVESFAAVDGVLPEADVFAWAA